MMTIPELILESGDWRARALPEMGGLLGGLDRGGVPILRTMPARSGSPLDAACFPMVPWCNRIAGGRFEWGRQTIALTPNFAPERHAIHGHGWQVAWDVAAVTADSCTLAYRHPACTAGWPWAYTAEQRIALSPEGCAIALTLTNLANTPMPAGLGLHPYLRRRPESRVRFSAERICEAGSDMIPTGRLFSPATFGDFVAANGATLPAAAIDHCYTGWGGAAVISDDCGIITLSARGATHLHVYAPQQVDVLCLEPVSHRPDAINARPAGMTLLAPGAQMMLELRIAASPA